MVSFSNIFKSYITNSTHKIIKWITKELTKTGGKVHVNDRIIKKYK